MAGLAYLFPGQGSQRVGMGQDLYARSPEARSIFDEADEILGWPLSQLCFEGPMEELTDTVNAQPAILTASLAALAEAQAAGAPAPAWMAGHSLGHFSALAAAGALEFADALRLVRARGEAMKRAGAEHPGGMAAIIRLDPVRLTQICTRLRAETGQYVGIANHNSPDQIVIAGEGLALEQAMAEAKAAGARRVIPLPVTVASHSPLMADAARALEAALEQIEIREPRTPVLSNVTARRLEGADEIRRDMVQQLTHPVQWIGTIEAIADAGGDTFVEIGPGNVLAGLVKRIRPEATIWSLSDDGGLPALLAHAAGR